MAKKFSLEIKVKIEVVPTSGDPTTHEVAVESSADVGAALREAGLVSTNRDFTLNGKPATLRTPIVGGKPALARRGASVTLRCMERPAGS